jgi:hypothetical protein
MRSAHSLTPVPDHPVPETPAAQTALRATIEAVLGDYQAVASYSHEDRFWESASGREAVYGWGTTIEPRAEGVPVHVWFDGLDNDIAVWTDGHGWRRRNRGVWHEWRDLTDLNDVLHGVTEVLRTLLSGYR